MSDEMYFTKNVVFSENFKSKAEGALGSEFVEAMAKAREKYANAMAQYIPGVSSASPYDIRHAGAPSYDSNKPTFEYPEQEALDYFENKMGDKDSFINNFVEAAKKEDLKRLEGDRLSANPYYTDYDAETAKLDSEEYRKKQEKKADKAWEGNKEDLKEAYIYLLNEADSHLIQLKDKVNAKSGNLLDQIEKAYEKLNEEREKFPAGMQSLPHSSGLGQTNAASTGYFTRKNYEESMSTAQSSVDDARQDLSDLVQGHLVYIGYAVLHMEGILQAQAMVAKVALERKRKKEVLEASKLMLQLLGFVTFPGSSLAGRALGSLCFAGSGVVGFLEGGFEGAIKAIGTGYIGKKAGGGVGKMTKGEVSNLASNVAGDFAQSTADKAISQLLKQQSDTSTWGGVLASKDSIFSSDTDPRVIAYINQRYQEIVDAFEKEMKESLITDGEN